MRQSTRRWVVGLFGAGLVLAATAAQAAPSGAAGSLDPSFGKGGKVLTSIAGGAVPGTAVLQPNGDIVVSAAIGGDFGLVRYLPSGALDKTFGTRGVARTGLENFFELPSLTLQPDGKIVVVGDTPEQHGEITNFAVLRFDADGALDPTFGTGGVVTTEFLSPALAGATEVASVALVQPDGKILVGGGARQGQNKLAPTMTAIARYNSNGTLDTTFGTGGEALATSVGQVSTLGLDASGDIFALDASGIAELSPTGQFDAAIAPARIVSTSEGDSGLSGGPSAFLPNGQFVVGESVAPVRHDTDVQVERFNAGGAADRSFTSPAFDYTGQEGQAADSAAALAVQPNDQVVVVGTHFASTSVFGVARLDADGGLDSGFGSGGTLTTSFLGSDGASAVALQPDGNIVVVGSSISRAGASELALARYLGQ